MSRSESNPGLPQNLSHGPLELLPVKVIQFGEGNFLRAFVDWMLDRLNEQGHFGGQVLLVHPTRRGRSDLLNAQDGLYTVLLRGVQNGRVVDQRRIVTAIRRALNPYTEWDDLTQAFSRPELRFVVSNTTEAGIAFVAEPHPPGPCPESFPAKITALLWERFQACAGDPARGLVFLPCELVDRNGATLRELVLRHAERWQLGGRFADWVNLSNHFLNTLVDRIVPGYPRDEAAALSRELGYEDALLDAAEPHHLWVIEGPRHLAEELPFHRVGLNVVWTDDLAPHRTQKVRILNGAHTGGALAAFHGGLDTVQQMVEDPVFGRFVRRAVFAEILPGMPSNAPDATAYAEAVFERFRNPFVRHELLSISLNSVAKWTARVLPSLLDYVQARGALPPLLTFSLAALIWFYRGEHRTANELAGRRDGQDYPIRDDAATLEAFRCFWAEDASDRLSANSVAGLPGHPSLPLGGPPDGTARGTEPHPDTALQNNAALVPVGGSPTGAGEPPAPSTLPKGDGSSSRAATLLVQTPLWTLDLNTVPGLADAVAAHLTAIAEDGMRETVARLVA